jgi:CubicO group peptidase (beta-lactamase class C family)
MLRTALLLAAALPLAGTGKPGHRAPDYWPTAGWRTSSPQAERVNADSLAALDAAFAAGKHGYIDAMLVIRNGRVIYERRYTQPYDSLFTGPDRRDWQYNYQHPNHHPWYRKTDLHTLQSVSKSVTSVLTGVAIHRGDLPHDSVAVMPYLAAYPVADQDPRRARMTLRHLLTMTAGIEWDEWTASYADSSNNCIQMEASNEWVRYVLSLPMAREPGDTFVYNSGATVLLGAVLQKATGQRADEYAKQHLFAPLGITAFHWKVSPDGVTDTEGGLYLAPRDLAKIGYLFLSDGVWDGRRLLPEGWVARSTTPVLEIRPGGAQYGLLWWMPPRSATGPRAYMAQGFGGQRLIVVPDLGLIAVFNGWNIYDKPELGTGAVLARLVAATTP